MELASKTGPVLLINAYLPFYDKRNLQTQLELYKDAVAYIENIIHSNPSHSYIILMDMNCNLYDSAHPYSKIIRDMMNTNELISAFDFMPSFNPCVDYT